MNKTVLIIIGIVCIIMLIILIAAIIPRLKAAVSRTPLWAYILLVILVIGALAFVGVSLFGPRGVDSLMSESIDGIEEGDAKQDTPVNEKSEEKGTQFNISKALDGNENGDSTIYISVNADTISIGSTAFNSLEDFEMAMESLAPEMEGHKIKLQDDYALATVYHDVRDYLDSAGYTYTEKQLE